MVGKIVVLLKVDVRVESVEFVEVVEKVLLEREEGVEV